MSLLGTWGRSTTVGVTLGSERRIKNLYRVGIPTFRNLTLRNTLLSYRKYLLSVLALSQGYSHYFPLFFHPSHLLHQISFSVAFVTPFDTKLLSVEYKDFFYLVSYFAAPPFSL